MKVKIIVSMVIKHQTRKACDIHICTDTQVVGCCDSRKKGCFQTTEAVSQTPSLGHTHSQSHATRMHALTHIHSP